MRVELDGQLAHPFGRTDEDVWRDNAVLVARSDVTLRYRWRHVVGDPCATAHQVATALRARGWSGTPRPCAPTCPLTLWPDPPWVLRSRRSGTRTQHPEG